MNKKYPPYSKQMLKEDYCFMFYGPDSWEACKTIYPFARKRSFLLEHGINIKDYKLDFLKGLHVIAKGYEDAEYKKRLAFEVLSAGALSIDFIMPEVYDLNDIEFFKEVDNYVESYVS
ncbi:MAG: hypothetical protein PHR19_02385 [Bacteroidales bacterium]|nr:hypothetical protein [Bacteroidales bacterium]